MKKIKKLRLVILIVLILFFGTALVSLAHAISAIAYTDNESLNQAKTLEVMEDDGIYDLVVLNEKIKTNITVTKEWDDNDDEYNIRPSEVYVTLNATSDGGYKLSDKIESTVALSEENDWTYTWNDLYKYDDYDNEIQYSVEEEKLEGNLANVFERTIEKTEEYTDDDDSYENWVVTNTYTGNREFTEKLVTKVWNDTEIQSEKRPETIKIILYKQSGSSVMEVAEEYELNTREEDNHLFENLPVYDECGNKITYIIEEEMKDDYYATTIDNESGIITNTFSFDQEYVKINATKNWDDNEIQAARRPESIKFVLMNGEDEVETLIACEENDWTVTFGEHINIEKFDENADEITYTVKEVEISDDDLYFYENEELVNAIEDDEKTYIAEMTNTFVVPDDTISVEVTKIWDDNDNECGARPSEIEVYLIANSASEYELPEEIEDLIILNEENEWMYVWEDLDKYDKDGNLIEYTVEEEELEGNLANVYERSIEKVDDEEEDYQSWEIINTYYGNREFITVTAKKDWNDSVLQALRRPAEVGLVLMDGNTEVETLVANEENEWTVVFGKEVNIPKYDAIGNEIQYTVKEVEIEEDDLHFYENDGIVKVVKDEDEVYTAKITNSFAVPDDKKDVEVTKIWDDNDNKNETRPDNVTVYVMGNGITYEITLTDSMSTDDDQNCWKKTVSLPEYDENGEEIEYVLTDELYVDGYEADFSNADENTVINSIVPVDAISDLQQEKIEPVNYEEELPYTGTNNFIVTILTIIGIFSMIIGITFYHKDN